MSGSHNMAVTSMIEMEQLHRRRASHFPPLRAGELFSTFLVRAAHRNGLEPWRFCNLLWPHVPVWTRDIDRSAQIVWLKTVATQIGIPLAAVRAATLLDTQAALGSNRPGNAPLVLAAGIYHQSRRRHGLQYCPDCLANRPLTYERSWRLAITVMCPVHGHALLCSCPHCDQPLAPHRNKRLNRDICGCCGGELVGNSTGCHIHIPSRVAALQSWLVPALLDANSEAVQAALDLRALIAVLVSKVQTERLANALGLRGGARGMQRGGVFEYQRVAARIAAINLASAWQANWPENFRVGAKAMGLTSRPFARRRVGSALAAEIAHLPERIGPPRRRRQPLVHTDVMQRLARKCPHTYAQSRASRLNYLSTPTSK